jgi:beta-carotene hydroxylase
MDPLTNVVPRVVQREKIRLPKDLDEVPPVAWPTVLLALLAGILFVSANAAFAFNALPYSASFGIAAVASYVAFTPMHDACHGAIATRKSGHRWMNQFVGWVCGAILTVPFSAFRVLHLEHHKFTNVPGKDPDLWASGIGHDGQQISVLPMLFLPLRWATIMWAYYVHYIRTIAGRPRREVVQTLTLGVLGITPYFLRLLSIPDWLSPVAEHLFYCNALPSAFAFMVLGFAFDYLPHRPSVNQDIYHGTSLVSITQHGYREADQNEPRRSEKKTDRREHDPESYLTSPLTIPLLFQNYHVVHHLYPWLPFYMYSAVWHRLGNEFRDRGTKIHNLFPLFLKA